MHRTTVRSLASLCAAVALTAGVGCTQTPTKPAGSARIALSTAALAPSVVEVIVTIGPGSAQDFTPFSASLTKGQDSWSGFIPHIPAGSQRTFDVVANDASHQLVQSGSTKADVKAGETAMVVVILGTPSGPVYGNKAPVIQAITATSSRVPPGGTVGLHVEAKDPDGDPITHLWSAACGTFDDAGKSSPVWTAPTATAPCEITA
jgi:hypothetical protein